MNVPQMYGPDFFTVLARHLHRIMDRPIGRSPADEKSVAFLIAVNFGHWNFFSEFPQFIAPLRRHRHVQFRTASGVAHLVVFESAYKGIFPVEDARAGRDMLCDTLKIVRFETALARC